MKTKLLLCATSALLITAITSQARNLPSPDGRYAVKAEASIELIDSTGQTILVLANNTSGATRVEIAWSSDSRRVAMAEDFGRGSAIFAAWTDGLAWHKTLQSDDDQAGIVRLAQQEFGGHLVSEQRVFAGWISSDSLRVKGSMTLSSGKRAAYEYVLQFRPGPGRLDRGGYEEGIIVGRDYKIL